MCYGISEDDDMAGQIEHDVTAIKKLVSRALEDGEQLHIRLRPHRRAARYESDSKGLPKPNQRSGN